MGQSVQDCVHIPACEGKHVINISGLLKLDSSSNLWNTQLTSKSSRSVSRGTYVRHNGLRGGVRKQIRQLEAHGRDGASHVEDFAACLL